VKVAEEPKASGISSRGAKALDPSKKIDAHGCFTKSGQEPDLTANDSYGGKSTIAWHSPLGPGQLGFDQNTAVWPPFYKQKYPTPQWPTPIEPSTLQGSFGLASFLGWQLPHIRLNPYRKQI
jgi:hypothetical protein